MTATENAAPARYDATCGECYGNYNTAERHDCTDPAQTGYAEAPADDLAHIMGKTVRITRAAREGLVGVVVDAYRIYGQAKVDVRVAPWGFTYRDLRAFGEFAEIAEPV